MQLRVDELEKLIDVENVLNYLKYRLLDTQELVSSLKPLSEGKVQNNDLSKSDARVKISAL